LKAIEAATLAGFLHKNSVHQGQHLFQAGLLQSSDAVGWNKNQSGLVFRSMGVRVEIKGLKLNRLQGAVGTLGR
jgi:hypothetical protein